MRPFILLLALLAILAPVIATWVGHPPNTPYTNAGLSSTGLPVAPSSTVSVVPARIPRSISPMARGWSPAGTMSVITLNGATLR